MKDDFKPYIAADAQLPELTWKAVALGIVLAAMMGAANAYLALKAGQIRLEGIDCDTRIIEAPPDQAIVQAAHEAGADLVVIGNAHMMGSGVPDRIVGSLACAVLVMHSGTASPEIDSAVANQA